MHFFIDMYFRESKSVLDVSALAINTDFFATQERVAINCDDEIFFFFTQNPEIEPVIKLIWSLIHLYRRKLNTVLGIMMLTRLPLIMAGVRS